MDGRARGLRYPGDTARRVPRPGRLQPVPLARLDQEANRGPGRTLLQEPQNSNRAPPTNRWPSDTTDFDAIRFLGSGRQWEQRRLHLSRALARSRRCPGPTTIPGLVITLILPRALSPSVGATGDCGRRHRGLSPGPDRWRPSASQPLPAVSASIWAIPSSSPCRNRASLHRLDPSTGLPIGFVRRGALTPARRLSWKAASAAGVRSAALAQPQLLF